MLLIEIVIDILKNTQRPLQLREIKHAVKNHKEYFNCKEIHDVKEESATISRCLSKYSTGSSPIIGVLLEETNKPKKFYLGKNVNSQILTIPELELHPYLVKFVNKRFNVISKTINAVKILKRIDKIGKWTRYQSINNGYKSYITR